MRDSGLPSFQRPKRYQFVAELPKGNTGKLNRRALREQHSGLVQAASSSAANGSGTASDEGRA